MTDEASGIAARRQSAGVAALVGLLLLSGGCSHEQATRTRGRDERRGARASETYRKAIEVDPTFRGGYHRYCASLYAERRFRESAEVASRGLQRFPGDAELTAWQGMSLLQLGQLAEGCRLLRSVYQAQPERFNFQLMTGRCCLRIKEYRCAVTALERYLRVRPPAVADKDHVVGLWLARSWVGLGERGRALAALDRVLRLKPGYGPAVKLREQLVGPRK